MKEKLSALYTERRAQLITMIKGTYPQIGEGAVVLFGAFEHERRHFRQESSFYYFSGVEEAGVVLVIDLSGKTILFVPHCPSRERWVASTLTPSKEQADELGVDEIRYLGAAHGHYQVSPLFNRPQYESLLTTLLSYTTHDKHALFTFCSADPYHYVEQKLKLERLLRFEPSLEKTLIDIEPLVARLRRTKSREEIERIYKAVELTMVAHEAAARVIEPGSSERDICSGIEYVFAEGGGRVAFPSIVATGPHSTILHYGAGKTEMKAGDVVVIDIGAEVDYYCADLTRTYPVSGIFTQRQREIYTLVLETQDYIASLAKPGIWLSNKDKPTESLQHCAQSFLEKRGYAEFFPHGIGHFLGLDVHDVGDTKEPLQEGDVITIEPGIYLPKEKFGIRIEDDYWIVKDGVVCLSESLPKEPSAIEEMAQSSMEFEEDEEYEDEDFQ
jgi:Xaa-Pro aminopeptidase